MKKFLNIILLSVLFFNIVSSQAVVENALSNISFGNANASLWQTVQSKLYYFYIKIAEVGFGIKTEDLKTEIKNNLEEEKNKLADLQKIVDGKKEEVKKLAELKSQLQDCSGLSGVALSFCNARNAEIQKQINSLGVENPSKTYNEAGLAATQENTTPMSSSASYPQGSVVGNGHFNQNIPSTLPDSTAYSSDPNYATWAPGPCGMPKGPMAYNIASESGVDVPIQIKTVFIGYNGKTQGLQSQNRYAGGYIPANIPKFAKEDLAKYGSGSRPSGDGYGSFNFGNYTSGNAFNYIQSRIEYWKLQVNRSTQCIVVDIDNCDSVGWANYKNILNQVQASNNRGGPKVMVFTKNPQICGGSEAFNHPVVVGAFVEEIDTANLQKLFQYRGSNTNKPILLAAGSGGSESKGNKLVENCNYSRNQKNVFASFDYGGEYSKIKTAISCGK